MITEDLTSNIKKIDNANYSKLAGAPKMGKLYFKPSPASMQYITR